MIRLISVLMVYYCLGCGGGPDTRSSSGVPEVGQLTPEKRTSVRHSLIKTLLDSHAYDSAVPLINQALKDVPNDARLHGFRATVLRERGRLEQALSVYTLALKFDPKLAEAHAGRGIVLNLLGQHDKATRAHQRATKLTPDHSARLNNLGFSLYLQRNYQEAVDAYEAAIKVDSRARVTFINLGFALAALGQEAKAKRAFGQVLDEAGILNNLALAQELKGDPNAARTLYKQALITDPKNQDAAQNLEALGAESSAQKETN
ncbi:MAG: tetratricopeptide repeat protein [Myxococcota bacterium]|nr:tetratricopeptide repeat protein [Myxococcota bacterium]